MPIDDALMHAHDYPVELMTFLVKPRLTLPGSGCTLTAFIEDAVRCALAEAKVRQKQGPPGVPHVQGHGAPARC